MKKKIHARGWLARLAPAPVPEGKYFIALSTPEGGYLFEGGSSFFVTNYLAIRLERNRDISQGAGLANAESRERFTTRGGAHAHQIRPSASQNLVSRASLTFES